MGEGTEDLLNDDEVVHDDNGNGYGGRGGDLLASDPGKAVIAECHRGGQVHVWTIADVFVVPGLAPG